MNYKALAEKTSRLDHGAELAADENPFSTNRVTGHSLNYPIADTCAPTRVCVETCYFGRGPSTWTAALRKQLRLLRSTERDPVGVAERVAAWAARLHLTYVRWNGGGDLFDASVVAINHAARLTPATPHWVVTRLPLLAVQIDPAPNVFVHFSVDSTSWSRVAAMRGYAGQWFWSYQGAPGERLEDVPAPVQFFDGYDPAGAQLGEDHCPLNAAADIAGVCDGCRRCFDGTAVERGRQLLPLLDRHLQN